MVAPPAATPREAAIHIGLPRTGTTTLQSRLFARHSELHYLGIYKRKKPAWARRFILQCRDPGASELMNGLLFQEHAPSALDQVARWRQIQAQEPRKRVVWSWEGLTADVYAMREWRSHRLADVMARAQVLVTIRHPVGLLESTYFQILRRNNRKARLHAIWYQPIDVWLERDWQGEIETLLDYARTIDLYCRAFGREAVHVLLYEDLGRDPEAYFTSVCRVLGIDEREGLKHTVGWRDNPSSPALVDIISRVRGGWLDRLRVRLAVRRQLRGTLRSAKGAEMPRIDAAGRAAIAERTREGNRQLAERFGLDLERWNYPL